MAPRPSRRPEERPNATERRCILQLCPLCACEEAADCWYRDRRGNDQKEHVQQTHVGTFMFATAAAEICVYVCLRGAHTHTHTLCQCRGRKQADVPTSQCRPALAEVASDTFTPADSLHSASDERLGVFHVSSILAHIRLLSLRLPSVRTVLPGSNISQKLLSQSELCGRSLR